MPGARNRTKRSGSKKGGKPIQKVSMDSYHREKLPRNHLVSKYWDKTKTYSENIGKLGIAIFTKNVFPIVESHCAVVNPLDGPPKLDSGFIDDLTLRSLCPKITEKTLSDIDVEIAAKLYTKYGGSEDYKAMSRNPAINKFYYTPEKLESILETYTNAYLKNENNIE